MSACLKFFLPFVVCTVHGVHFKGSEFFLASSMGEFFLARQQFQRTRVPTDGLVPQYASFQEEIQDMVAKAGKECQRKFEENSARYPEYLEDGIIEKHLPENNLRLWKADALFDVVSDNAEYNLQDVTEYKNKAALVRDVAFVKENLEKLFVSRQKWQTPEEFRRTLTRVHAEAMHAARVAVHKEYSSMADFLRNRSGESKCQWQPLYHIDAVSYDSQEPRGFHHGGGRRDSPKAYAGLRYPTVEAFVQSPEAQSIKRCFEAVQQAVQRQQSIRENISNRNAGLTEDKLRLKIAQKFQ